LLTGGASSRPSAADDIAITLSHVGPVSLHP
jgi:hypothetical protein